MPKKTSITGSELFIVGNSEEDWKVVRDLRFFTQYVQTIPISEAAETSRLPIKQLEERCIKVGCEAWEKDIDERVAAPYGP